MHWPQIEKLCHLVRSSTDFELDGQHYHAGLGADHLVGAPQLVQGAIEVGGCDARGFFIRQAGVRFTLWVCMESPGLWKATFHGAGRGGDLHHIRQLVPDLDLVRQFGHGADARGHRLLRWNPLHRHARLHRCATGRRGSTLLAAPRSPRPRAHYLVAAALRNDAIARDRRRLLERKA